MILKGLKNVSCSTNKVAAFYAKDYSRSIFFSGFPITPCLHNGYIGFPKQWNGGLVGVQSLLGVEFFSYVKSFFCSNGRGFEYIFLDSTWVPNRANTLTNNQTLLFFLCSLLALFFSFRWLNFSSRGTMAFLWHTRLEYWEMLALRENILSTCMQDCDLHVQTDQNMQASDLGNKPRKILRKPNMNLTESIQSIHELSKRARII